MLETSKSLEVRLKRGDFDNYLRGQGIDIGAGNDPLRVKEGSVRTWDVKDGDAQLLRGVQNESFDFVYSSHCLEHMRDVPETLKNWTRVLKPAGYLYVVVPDYLLYEKLTWPSRFNSDHRQSFSDCVARDAVERPNHWHIKNDIEPLLNQLNVDLITFSLECWNFNFNAGLYDQTPLGAITQVYFIGRKRGVASL